MAVADAGGAGGGRRAFTSVVVRLIPNATRVTIVVFPAI
jgi:hypothetical protein